MSLPSDTHPAISHPRSADQSGSGSGLV